MCSSATLKEFHAELNSAVRKGHRLLLLHVCGRHRRGVLSDIQRPVAEQSPGTAGVTASPQDARSPCSLLKLQEPPPNRGVMLLLRWTLLAPEEACITRQWKT